jgi:flavodoxin
MNTLVIFYSYGGKTKAIAAELAARESADTAEILDENRPGIIKAYTAGIFASRSGKAWGIRPLGADFAKYERLIILSPVWAGNPPPAVNAALELLPEGKTIDVKMVSASGKSNCKERLELVIKAKGCVLDGFEDIRGGK